MKAKDILRKIKKYAEDSTAYLSASSDYSRGYRDGVMRAKEIILEMLDDYVPKCPHCGRTLTPSEMDGYEWQCTKCDEDFYDIEVEHPND